MKRAQTLLSIVLFCCLIFPAACGSNSGQQTIVQGRRGSGTVAATQQTADTEAVPETENVQTDAHEELYMIAAIDTTRKTILFTSLSGDRQIQYGYDTGTRFQSKYGNSTATESFQSGDVVTFEVSASTDRLTKVSLTDQVWVQDDITNYSVDEEHHALTIGRTKYSYDLSMPVFSGAARISLADLADDDVIRAVGIDRQLISVSVTKGHGYLQLSHTDLFNDSFICVGDKIFEQVKPDLKIEVPEGTHLVTVANNGYGSSKEVTITRDQTTNLNLDDLKGEGPKFCTIKFDVGVEGAVLTIDGEVVDYSKEVSVQYGVHSIAVGAEGYDTVSEKLVVNSEKAEIEIGLTKSSGSSDTDSASGSTTGAASGGDSASSGTQNNNSNNNTNNSNNSTAGNTASGSGTNSNSGNTASSSGNNTNSNQNTDSSNDSSQTDYLTTLYNLLTSINNSGTGSSTGTGSSSSGTSSNSYDSLTDQ